MKAAAYARYSTDNQTDNSIATQLDAITKYCIKNNHTLVAIFTDEAKTGTNVDREGFQRLLGCAARKEFECVIIYDMTRGSRNVSDWFNFRDKMRALKIEVLSVTEKLGDVSDPMGFLTELLGVGMGQIEVLRSRQKSIAGKIQKAKDGVFLGGFPPLGYDIVNRKYVINEKEADVVRFIFQSYGEGHSYDYILMFTNDMGVVGKRGRPVGKNSLFSILNNDRYIGVYSWNRYNNRYMKHWAGGKPSPEAETVIENGIPPIVDIEIWNKVRIRMDNNKKNATNTAVHEYLLSGKIECKKCGNAYTGKTNKNSRGVTTRYYVCGNKSRTKLCDAMNINADLIEDITKERVMTWLKTVDYDKVAQNIETLAKSRTSGICKEEMEKLNQEKVNLKFLLSKCENTEQTLLIQRKCDEVDIKIKSLSEKELKSVVTEITHDKVIAQLKKDALCTSEDDIKRLVKDYVQKIYAYGDDIEIAIGVTMIGSPGMEPLLYTTKFTFSYKSLKEKRK